MSVLTKKELEALRKVKTTRKQARRILKRNKALLKFVEQLPTTEEEYNNYDGEIDYYGDVGCPHCSMGGCSNCAWAALLEEQDGDDYLECCKTVAFGGYSYNDLSENNMVGLEYWADDEGISVSCDYLTSDAFFEELKKVKIFLQGHIEWAKDVLKKYGE